MIKNKLDKLDENTRICTTPKGIAALSLLESGLVNDLGDARIDGFWTIFEKMMSEYNSAIGDNT